MKRTRNTAVALLAIALLLVLEYGWVRSPQVRRELGTATGPALGPAGCPADTQQHESPGSAEWDWRLKKLDGTETSFEQFRGKAVFLNVWATWCAPCRRELPDIQALEESLRGENVAFALVSEEELEPVKGFVEEEQLAAPVYISASRLPEAFESRTIPATFLVDRSGKVVHRKLGVAAWNNDACRNYLRALAHQEPAGAPAQGAR